jgi:hypothetical protein
VEQEKGENDMSELIWLTIPHQLPPVAVWYDNKDKLIEALNEHELCDDTRNTIDDFDELVDEASMSYNSTRVIDRDDYQALRSEDYSQLGHHQRFKAQREIENVAEVLGWEK